MEDFRAHCMSGGAPCTCPPSLLNFLNKKKFDRKGPKYFKFLIRLWALRRCFHPFALQFQRIFRYNSEVLIFMHPQLSLSRVNMMFCSIQDKIRVKRMRVAGKPASYCDSNRKVFL